MLLQLPLKWHRSGLNFLQVADGGINLVVSCNCCCICKLPCDLICYSFSNSYQESSSTEHEKRHMSHRVIFSRSHFCVCVCIYKKKRATSVELIPLPHLPVCCSTSRRIGMSLFLNEE